MSIRRTSTICLTKRQSLKIFLSIECDDLQGFQSLTHSHALSLSGNNRKHQNTTHLHSKDKALMKESMSKLLSINCDEYGKKNILFICCQFGSYKILQYLFNNIAKKCGKKFMQGLFDWSHNIYKNTLLMTCVIPNRKNSKNSKNETSNKLKCLKFLLNDILVLFPSNILNEQINCQNNNKMTLLMLCSKYNNFNGLKMILDFNCNVNLTFKTRNGDCVFTFAALLPLHRVKT